jgi:hypothetical protein
MKPLVVSMMLLALCAVMALAVGQTSSANAAPWESPYWDTATIVFEDSSVVVGKPDVEQDSLGNVHAIWYYSQGATNVGVMYASRNLAGAWSWPTILPAAGTGAVQDPTLLIDGDDVVHVFWAAHNPDTYTAHTYLLPGGDWQAPELLDYGREDVNARVAPDGTLHLMDKFSNTHLWLPRGESWQTEAIPFNIRDFELDSQDVIHAIGSMNPNLAYAYKEPDGVWVTEVTTYTKANYPELAIGPDDVVHVAWMEYVEYACDPSTCERYDLRYGRIEAGSLTAVTEIDRMGVDGHSPLRLEAAGGGRAHLIWPDAPLPEETAPEGVGYAGILGDGSLGLMDSRPGDKGSLAVAWNGDVHLVWRDTALLHQWREPDAPWSPVYQPDAGELGISWAGGFDIAPGHQDAPDSLHALHLLFAATNMSVYNVFSTAVPAPEPVTADFSASPTRGRAPLLVSFSNLSMGDYGTCEWDFGDGGSSNDCGNPSHTYGAPGTWDVTLTVRGAGGVDTATKAAYITVVFVVYLPLVVGSR